MARVLPRLAAAMVLAACTADQGPTEPYAFVAAWDCGPTRLTFTDTTYDDATNRYPILSGARDGANYTLRLANGYTMARAAVTETGLTRVSGPTGAQLNCRRIGSAKLSPSRPRSI